MSEGRKHKIYRLTFEIDGAQYVGRTRQTIAAMLYRHGGRQAQGHQSNTELRNRLRAGEEYELEILFDGLTEAKAKSFELAQIRLLDKPINCCGITRAPVWRHGTPPAYATANRPEGRPRKEGVARCSLCHAVKPTDQFYADRHRHNGIDSRCKACRRIQCREQDRSLAKEGSRKPGYWRAKPMCIAKRATNGAAE